MNARFFLKDSPRPRDFDKETGKGRPVEYVEIATGRDGADVVVRPATPEDKRLHQEAYWAFNPQAKAEATTPRPDEAPVEAVEEEKSGFFSRRRK